MRSANFSPDLDVEQGGYGGIFEEEMIRKAFIRKVYFILTLQLMITLGVICVFVYSEDMQDYVAENHYLLWLAFGIAMFTLLALTCCPDLRRRPPANYIFLTIFTLAQGFVLGIVSSIYEPMIVLTSVGITAAVCFTLTLFAMQTKLDFTVMMGFMIVVLVVFLLTGLLMLFFPSHTMKLVYCSFGILIFSLFLLIDTQLMLGGEHHLAISPDEYVFAALNLYIDIVQLFLFILALLGNND